MMRDICPDLPSPDPMATSMGPMPMGPIPNPRSCTEASPTADPTRNAAGDRPLWPYDVWRRIDGAVAGAEAAACPAVTFRPSVDPETGALTVDSDTISQLTPKLQIDEAATFPLVELWVEFALTPQQVQREAEVGTARVLAARAANIVSQGTDLLVLQGDGAAAADPLFVDRRALLRSGPAGPGLVGSVPEDPLHHLEVPALDPGTGRYGDGAYRAVTEARARLESLGHYGPYALLLPTLPYADLHAPLSVTLTTPYLRLTRGPVDACHGTGALPPRTGLVISVGGNSMDLVEGQPTTAEYLQQDAAGKFIFRVYRRFALRVKDPSAILRLDFAGT
ncbi:MAG: encapsulin [Acidobacteriota bacterium]